MGDAQPAATRSRSVAARARIAPPAKTPGMTAGTSRFRGGVAAGALPGSSAAVSTNIPAASAHTGGLQVPVSAANRVRGLPAFSARTGVVVTARAASTTPSPAASAQVSAAAANPVVSPLPGTQSLFGLKAPAAPANPVGAFVGGWFLRVIGVVPIAGTATVSTPDPETGAVTGTPGFTVPAGLPLTYNAPTTSTGGGTVSINTSTGAYSYTPTLATWLAAANTPTQDTFTITASDRLAATTKTVTVTIRPPIKVITTIPVGALPSAVAVSPDGSSVYVTNFGSPFNQGASDTVSVIDTATNTVTATIPVGSNPHGVAVSPDGTHAYVTN